MVEPYKPPHMHSTENIATFSTIGRLDHLENRFHRIEHTISGWDQKLDENLESLEKILTEKLVPMTARGIL